MLKKYSIVLILFSICTLNAKPYQIGVAVSDTIGEEIKYTALCQSSSLEFILDQKLTPYITGLSFKIEITQVKGSIHSNFKNDINVGDEFLLPQENPNDNLKISLPLEDDSFTFIVKLEGVPTISGESYYCELFIALTEALCHNSASISNLNEKTCVVQDSTLNYFPLNLGNTWSYKSANYLSVPTTSDYVFVDTLTINDNLYYLQNITRSNDSLTGFCSTDTFRVDDSGRIIKRIYGHDIVWFDFSMPNGAVYQIDYNFLDHSNDFIMNVHVSRNITTETYAGVFTNCINLYFDIPEACDEELSYFFSPDIGIVRIYGESSLDEWLLSANIEGKSYTSVPKSRHPSNEFRLEQNYPNPFNPTTTIEYTLEKSGKINLSVFNLKGQLIQTLIDGFQIAGEHKIAWTARELSSGIYFCQLKTGEQVSTRKLIIQK